MVAVVVVATKTAHGAWNTEHGTRSMVGALI